MASVRAPPTQCGRQHQAPFRWSRGAAHATFGFLKGALDESTHSALPDAPQPSDARGWAIWCLPRPAFTRGGCGRAVGARRHRLCARRHGHGCGAATAPGSARGVPALSQPERRFRSAGKRSARSCTRASGAGASECDCQTPTARAHSSSGRRTWPSAITGPPSSRRPIAPSRSTARPPSPSLPGRWSSATPSHSTCRHLGDLAISLYLPETVTATTEH